MIALVGATVLTMCGQELEQATILVQGDKILAVDTRLDIPTGFELIPVHGKIITPGLIDAHTHLGVYEESVAWAGEDVNENSEPSTPSMHVLDAINPADIGISEARQGGITTVMIAPGSSNPIGGQCVIAKTANEAVADDMLLVKHAGLKVAFGENPRQSFGVAQKKAPVTRMATANIIREAFYRAKRYLEQPDSGKFDLDLEAIARVLRGEMPLRAHAHRADDIVTAVRIAREFDVEIVIEHGTESYLVAEFLAQAAVPVVIGPTLVTRVKSELKDKNMATPAILQQHGIATAMMSDHPVIPSAFLPVYAGLATRYGLDETAALAMITAQAADILGLGNRIGRILPGMDADLVVWSGHPFHLASRPELVMINGQYEQVHN